MHDSIRPIESNSKTPRYDNHIAIVEALVPNKTDALQYLDNESDIPDRYARVTVNQGAQEQAGIYMYMVGPLPVNGKTTIQPLTFPYNAGRNFVRDPLPDYGDIVAWFAEVGKDVADMVEDLLGEVVNPGHLKPAPPLMAVSRPVAFENNTVSIWATVHSPGYRMDSWSLLAQGLYCRFDISGRDPKQWKIHEWFYNGVSYSSTGDFRAAWEKGEVQKMPPNRDGKWSEAQPDKQGIPGREKNTPIMIQPDGPRYKIDEQEKFVSWMGWDFYLNTVASTGLGVWDIKFKGERIIYELGLQEAMAHYAGDDPMSIGMLWLDTLFGMGFNMYELVPGFDCPAYATYLPTSFRTGDTTVLRNNSICVFEYTADHAIQRHTTPMHVSVSRNSYLIVRTVATVGNYDYTLDYTFYLDGAIEVKVRASGYIFGAYHQLEMMRKDFSSSGKCEAASYDYGYQVHDLVASSMHDHVINFKADFDIAGTANTVYRVGIDPYHHKYPWDEFERSTMRLNHKLVEKETALNWPANSGAMYVILNNESTNEWGEKRGYRITPGTGMGTPPHLTVKNSSSMANSAHWAYSDLHILRHHDWERKSASEFNAMEPLAPLIDFSKYLNEEDVVQEDLVVYFNLGTHHVAHSGDIPNTLMHTASSGVMFVPHNWGSRDVSRESAQGVLLEMGKSGEGSKITYFGGKYEGDVTVGVVSFSLCFFMVRWVD